MTSVPRGVDGLTYLGDWLTLDQAAAALGIPRADLRPLWEDGDIEVTRLWTDQPGGWRIRIDTVHDLLAAQRGRHA